MHNSIILNYFTTKRGISRRTPLEKDSWNIFSPRLMIYTPYYIPLYAILCYICVYTAYACRTQLLRQQRILLRHVKQKWRARNTDVFPCASRCTAITRRRPVICMWTEDRLNDRRQIIALYSGALDNDRRVSGRIPRELGRVLLSPGNITLSSILVDRLENHRSWQHRYPRRMPGIDSRVLVHDAIIRLAKYRRLIPLIHERIPRTFRAPFLPGQTVDNKS